jgi:hypothetical protein
MPFPPDGKSDNYQDRQAQHDREYEQAWENSPQEFKESAGQAGLVAESEDRSGMALEYNENFSRVGAPGHSPSFHIPDMANLLDDYVDEVIEKYGIEHADFIRSIAVDLKKPMEEEQVRNRSLLLGRVSCYLICDEKGNVLARIHALLHSIPRLASAAGYPSLRASAKHCKVSAEWLRRTRDKWCYLLDLEVPSEGKKSSEAKAKYRMNALTNHWRNQKFKVRGKTASTQLGLAQIP